MVREQPVDAFPPELIKANREVPQRSLRRRFRRDFHSFENLHVQGRVAACQRSANRTGRLD